jgi:hypothetical protein
MKKFTFWSALAHVALSIMSLIWAIYAWNVLWEGGFTKSFRHSKETTYVDGFGAVFIAFIFFSLAAISLCIVFKRVDAPRFLSVATASVLLGIPIMYLIVR